MDTREEDMFQNKEEISIHSCPLQIIRCLLRLSAWNLANRYIWCPLSWTPQPPGQGQWFLSHFEATLGLHR